ncbi:MAG: DUF2378 family protein [Polyangiaceae bacterium]|nr:DUF2378 family protein [Polyangiaceae bacterium]
MQSTTEVLPHAWGSKTITLSEATAFAQNIGVSAEDRTIIAKNLATFPPTIEVRGLFFEGMFRILEQRFGAAGADQVRRAAGIGPHIVPFRHYPHRDFYRLYYMATPRLQPGVPFSTGLRRVSQTFFPIFRSSLLGRTMSALMGEEPKTILPLLSKAYNLSVNGNSHRSEMTGENELTWHCEVEPVIHYEETFAGIVEGTMTELQRKRLKVVATPQPSKNSFSNYKIVIRW